MGNSTYNSGRMSETVKISKMHPRAITNNLTRVWEQATPGERDGGVLAYDDYHQVMCEISNRYDVEPAKVAGAFCALSPNSDWMGNLRSAITMTHGWSHGWSEEEVTVTTYNANRGRAWRIMEGEPFESVFKGPKVRDFYRSIIEPQNQESATIDGHIANVARGQQNGMWYSGLTISEYRKVKSCLQRLAKRNGILPLQMQGVLWFAWKRIHNILAADEAVLFGEPLRPYVRTDWIQPFPRRQQQEPVEDKQLLLPF